MNNTWNSGVVVFPDDIIEARSICEKEGECNSLYPLFLDCGIVLSGELLQSYCLPDSSFCCPVQLLPGDNSKAATVSDGWYAVPDDSYELEQTNWICSEG